MKPRRQLFWLPGSLSLLWLVTSPTRAQIVQDASLPNPSIVTENGNTSVITGGTQAGPNLLHSFREFSVPTGLEASFQQIDQGISNVISRVTGSSVSSIDGRISVLQANGTVSSANFFLLNPNGIIFGPNATLNIGGSFLGSTANSLKFANGSSFSATNSQTTDPLLLVSVPIGLQFGSPAGSIQVRGAGLRVPSGKTLGLVGGNLTLVGGGLMAAGGRIELGSVTAPVTPDLAPVQVSLTPMDNGWALGYEGVQNFQDIQSHNARVIASGSGGGDIQVQGRRVTLTDGSQMLANTQGSGIGGTLTVIASESVELSGRSEDRRNSSGLRATVARGATGAGGTLTIKTERLLVQGGAQVTTSTFGEGQGGHLTVQATDSVELIGYGTSADGSVIPSSLFANAEAGATGTGGNLTIDTDRLSVQNGAQVSVTTRSEFNQANAGRLTVRATDVELVGVAISADGQLLTNDRGLIFPSGLFAGTGIGSKADGGTLTIATDQLSLRDGAVVQTSTLGAGNAGNLIVQATDSVELIGTATYSRFPSSLLAVSGGIPGSGLEGVPEALGRGGDLRIETGELIVQNGAAVAVGSLNTTSNALGAGSLQVQAQSIRLENLGELTAATASGDGGDITLQVRDLLLLRRNSNISTTAGIAGAGGNGGNITIYTPFIVAVPSEDSNITANAFTGNGGRVQITAQGVFGLERREKLTSLSEITAFSVQNSDLNGVVEINTPDVDPSRGLVVLPAELVDASGLIASGCGAPGRQGQSEFIITGRGGLPPNPSDTLSSDTVWSDLRPQTRQAETQPSAESATQQLRPLSSLHRGGESLSVPTNSTTGQLVEAQGWVINNLGEVVLTEDSTHCHTP